MHTKHTNVPSPTTSPGQPPRNVVIAVTIKGLQRQDGARVTLSGPELLTVLDTCAAALAGCTHTEARIEPAPRQGS